MDGRCCFPESEARRGLREDALKLGARSSGDSLDAAERKAAGDVIGYCGLIDSGRGVHGEPELAFELLRRVRAARMNPWCGLITCLARKGSQRPSLIRPSMVSATVGAISMPGRIAMDKCSLHGVREVGDLSRVEVPLGATSQASFPLTQRSALQPPIHATCHDRSPHSDPLARSRHRLGASPPSRPRSSAT